MQLLESWPTWAGSAPMWGMFILVAIITVRTSPQWLETWSRLKLARAQQVSTRISELEQQIDNCHAECAEQIKKLTDELHGERRARVQEQASLIMAILKSVKSPELEQVLSTMESVQLAIRIDAGKELK